MTRGLLLLSALLSGALVLPLLPLGGAGGGGSGGARAEPPDFAREILPILSRRCFACHGPDAAHREADLALHERDEALRSREGGAAVVPGDPEASLLLARVAAADPDLRMPPPDHGEALAEDEVALLRLWIRAGAPWSRPWALVPPRRPDPPSVSSAAAPGNAIDAFLIARLEEAGLEPAPEAEPAELLRRVSFALTGLPPTPEELLSFLGDRGDDAYERRVDRLLGSNAYAERWAAVWLDLARYADSTGYASDFPREIWRYRDWVIEAISAGMPFDEFSIRQLAGDLLPDATTEDRIAAAFHRNTMTNNEGGTDDEEFRVAAVHDRVATTLQVWNGLTAGCARCHDHKFDSLSQREYYRLFAFFDQSEDADRPDDAPRIAAPTRDQARRLAEIDAELQRIDERLAAPDPALDAEQAAWEARPGAIRWEPVVPRRAATSSGARLEIGSEGLVEATGPVPEVDLYSLDFGSALERVTQLRLELLPGPAGRVGRGEGNVVVDSLRLRARPLRPTTRRARRLRIELDGRERILSLAEVRVWSGETELARGRPTRQSSTDFGGGSERAVDGETDGVYDRGSVTHTGREDDPWWEVEFAEEREVERVEIFNRTDGDQGRRLSGARVLLLGDDGDVVFETRLEGADAATVAIDPRSAPLEIPWRRAAATHEQSGWEVEGAFDDPAEGRTGWALAPRTDREQAAVFELRRPLPAGPDHELELLVAQRYGARHVAARLRAAVTDAEVFAPPLSEELRSVLARAPGTRDPEAAAALRRFFRERVSEGARAARGRRAGLEASRAALKIPTVPTMRELPPGRRRTTRIHVKGNFLVQGEVVEPGVPAALPPLDEGAPPDRLALARWLFRPDHPLTARVTANRLWARVFGRGLVETEEDFGTQGSLPSHPGLLDWLAVELRDGGWDTRALLKTLVLSSAFRRSADATPEMLARDPENRLLSRGPRLRLDAEMIRDQALAASGLLARTVGGPSVHPPQPAGLWRAAFDSADREWPTSTGEDRWRRGLYTFLRRTIPHPTMTVFDAPSREVCALRRRPTNTPLQALATLNDPAFVECAQALARRLLREAPGALEDRIERGFLLVVQRLPRPREVELLRRLHAAELERYAADPAAAVAAATEPLGPLGTGADPARHAELAALTVVAGTLLNLDAAHVY